MEHNITQLQEMGYDRSVGMFSPQGLLLQVEYSEKAVALGTPVLGLVTKDSVVIIGDKKVSSRLLVKDSIKKVFKINNSIMIGASGVMSDARRLVEKSQVLAQENFVHYNRDLDLLSLVKEIANVKQYSTQAGGLRPFGCSLIYVGFEKGSPSLYLTRPSGIYMKFLAVAIGKNSDKINEILEEKFKVLDTDKAIKFGLDIFKEVLADDFKVDRFDVCVMRKDGFDRIDVSSLK